MDHRIFALGAFLYVEEAFDNTSFEAMGKTRADHEMHFTTSRWIAAMLSNRMVPAEIRGVSSTMMVRRKVYCHRFCEIWLLIPCWFVWTMRAYGLKDLRMTLQLLLMKNF
jgi:hypothetical protein